MIDLNKIHQNDNLTGIPLPDSSVDLIITDPLYDFNTTQMEFIHNELLRVCRGDLIIFSPPENQWVFPNLTKYLFWIKTPSTKNSVKSYSRFVEMIFLYQRSTTWNNFYHWSNYTGVYDDKVVGLSDHPYEKPISLIERFIRLHSNTGDLILDPFSGSGIIPKSCNRLNRNWIGFDIDQIWIDVFDRETAKLNSDYF